jgi:site-specific recombinase XerD
MATEIHLQAAVEQYLVYLAEVKAQKPSTVGTAGRALALLANHLGPDKFLAETTPEDIAAFKASEAATMLHGKRRAWTSIVQIRTICRYFLAWGVERGWVDEAVLAPLATVPVASRPRTKSVLGIAQRHQ